jgi:hypothetical protein
VVTLSYETVILCSEQDAGGLILGPAVRTGLAAVSLVGNNNGGLAGVMEAEVATKIFMTCTKGHEAEITIKDAPLANLQEGGHLILTGEMNTPQPCPVCGGQLTTPGGHYEKNETGFLVRLGDAPTSIQ